MKKRYTNENQILAEIDRQKQRAIDLLSEAESLEASARELFKIPEMVEDAGQKKEEAKRLRKLSANIIDKRLPRLGNKLSEFRTQPLIALNGQQGIGDESVAMKG